MNERLEETLGEMTALERDLHDLISKRFADGKLLAEAKEGYAIAKANMLASLRKEGYPATLAQDLARGEESVAALRKLRDVMQVSYDTRLETINAVKRQMTRLEIKARSLSGVPR